MDKPTKPTNLIPRSFGGNKNDFSTSLQSTGYEDGVPAIYGGDNLNYQLDATGKELDYCEKICDFINDIPIGKTVTVDSNNKLVYEDLKELPSQANNDGKYLTTNCTSPSWTELSAANRDLSNLTNTGTSNSAGYPMPSSTYKNLTLGASGSSYTAPANGWIQFTATAPSGNDTYILVAAIGDTKDGLCMEDRGQGSLNAYIPVNKGQAFKVTYDPIAPFGVDPYDRFEFIYANGSESEAS